MADNKRPEAGRPNKQAGALIVAQHTGQPLPFPLPHFDVDWHSPNTEMQRCALWLHAYSPGHMLHAKAVERAVANLKYQRRYGHQKLRNANEFNTDGHAAHWIRAMAALLKSALEVGNATLVELAMEWWGCWLWLADNSATPDKRVVALGARFEGGEREERNTAYRLLTGESHKSIKGDKFWQNARESQDIFGLHLLRLLVDGGAFNDLVPVQPTSAERYEIVRYQDGHVTRGDWMGWERGHGSGAVPVCWVRYDTGEIGTTEPPPDLGREIESVVLKAAPPAEAA